MIEYQYFTYGIKLCGEVFETISEVQKSLEEY